MFLTLKRRLHGSLPAAVWAWPALALGRTVARQTWKGPWLAAATACLLVAAPRVARADQPQVAFDGCDQLDTEEIRRLLVVEMGARPGGPSWLLARCEGLVVIWTAAAVDVATRQRRVDVNEVPSETRERVVALAGAELSRRLHEPAVAEPARPRPAAPVSLPPPSLPLPWQLVVGVEARTASPVGALAFGPGASMIRRLGPNVGAELALGVGSAHVLANEGSVDAGHARIAALGLLVWSPSRTIVRLGLGAAAGVAWLDGEPVPGGGFRGRSAVAGFAGPCASATLLRGLGDHAGVELRFEVGQHLARIEALAGSAAVARFTGPWVALRLGVTTP